MSSKPTSKPGWIPDNATNITDPASLKTNGVIGGVSYVVANYENWFRNITSQWINYTDNLFGLTVYVETTSGSDTTGTGESASPFQTLKKAVDTIGRVGKIVLNETGEYHVTADIDATDKIIYVSKVSGAEIICDSYLDTTNKIYHITMNNSAFLYEGGISTGEPASTGVNWASSSGESSCFYCETGRNFVSIETGLFDDTTVATGGNVALVYCENGASADIFVNGSVTTNSIGYVIQSDSKTPSSVTMHGLVHPIDDDDYVKTGGTARQYEVLTADAGATIWGDTYEIGILGASALTTNKTASIAGTALATAIETALDTLLNANFEGSTGWSTDVSITQVGSKVAGMQIVISGSWSDGYKLPFGLYFKGLTGSTREGIFRNINAPQQASYNITSIVKPD